LSEIESNEKETSLTQSTVLHHANELSQSPSESIEPVPYMKSDQINELLRMDNIVTGSIRKSDLKNMEKLRDILDSDSTSPAKPQNNGSSTPSNIFR